MVAVVFSVVGLFYYLRIVKLMYFDEPGEPALVVANPLRLVISVNALSVLVVGLFPGALLGWCLAALTGADQQPLQSTCSPGKVAGRAKSRFPKGWDEKRVSELVAHYEAPTEDEMVDEDEAMLLDPEQTVMEDPSKLVPAVRELIAKHEEPA